MIANLGKYNTFTMNEEEERHSQSFSLLHKAYFQNRRYELVLELDALPPDFQNPTEYFYRRAQVQAKIDMLTELIELEVPSSLTNVDNHEGNEL